MEDDKKAKYDRFVRWGVDNGVYVHPAICFRWTKEWGMQAVVDEHRSSVAAGENFLKVPYNITLSYFNAISAGKSGTCYHPHSAALPEGFLHGTVDHDIVNCVFLVQQYLLGELSFWYPYIQILVQPSELATAIGIPLVWEQDDLKWLRGTYLQSWIEKKRSAIKERWEASITLLAKHGWDTSEYTLELGLWAYFIFDSRSFWSISIQGDIEKIKPEYHVLIRDGINLDLTARVLLPFLDSLNHAQEPPLEYALGEGHLALAKTAEMPPGSHVTIAYDKDTQRFNNTTLLRDFGFVLPDNEFCELVLPAPFDLTDAKHPDHVVWSTPATVDEPYAFADDAYMNLMTLRSPSRDRRGLLNPTQTVPALQYFNPTLISMTAFEVAKLAERAALRDDPDTFPTERNQKATSEYLTRHLQTCYDSMRQLTDEFAEPRNQRQHVARLYRLDQLSIAKEILQCIKVT